MSRYNETAATKLLDYSSLVTTNSNPTQTNGYFVNNFKKSFLAAFSNQPPQQIPVTISSARGNKTSTTIIHPSKSSTQNDGMLTARRRTNPSTSANQTNFNSSNQTSKGTKTVTTTLVANKTQQKILPLAKDLGIGTTSQQPTNHAFPRRYGGVGGGTLVPPVPIAAPPSLKIDLNWKDSAGNSEGFGSGVPTTIQSARVNPTSGLVTKSTL